MGPAEAARKLGVNTELVKKWAYIFKEYLSESANPTKGISRQFSINDIIVLNYIGGHWGDSDIEEIKQGLDENEHELEWEFRVSITPIFQELPDNIDETWRHGVLLSCLSDKIFDRFTLANAYKWAGDTISETFLSDPEGYELIFPILYVYRHAIELYFKSVIPSPEKTHDLTKLFGEFHKYIEDNFKETAPRWFTEFVSEFINFDEKNATVFRYNDQGIFNLKTGDGGEFWVDVNVLKKKMNWLSDSFLKIRRALLQLRL
ncbi:MAG: hypothetical protein PVH61_18855 [Candidatus Aminicenantes bacterium]|jgi:hypothetical protein